jgi:hypothetical protein
LLPKIGDGRRVKVHGSAGHSRQPGSHPLVVEPDMTADPYWLCVADYTSVKAVRLMRRVISHGADFETD